MSNYTIYHLHSMLSNGVTNIDSITDFHDYVDAAKECGMSALGFSEHGCIFAWLKKKEAIEAAGMKYIHAIEAYLTEDISETTVVTASLYIDGTIKKNIELDGEFERDGKQYGTYTIEGVEHSAEIVPNTRKTERGPNKQKDNYHCVLIARNYDGVKEINKLTSKSFNRDDGHFYYSPRVTFDELFATSNNVLITTACLGGVLNRGATSAKEKMLRFLRENPDRCFLEIQHHNCEDQIAYNKMLLSLSQELGIKLIAGTDTHALNDEHMKGRALLQRAKDVRFDNEESWDLTFKTYDQLIAAYKKQGSLPMDVVKEAIENTNYLADLIEPFTVDYSPKYPKLYDNSEEVFKKKINEGFIRRGLNKKPNVQEYIDRIHYEYETYKHNGAIDFMLLEEDYKSAMRARGIKFGYSRGSVSGSIIAYILGITEVDSLKYNLNFERFMNRERISLADVDTDWLSEDRKIVKDYLHDKPGLYCCDIVTFNTIAAKGAVNDAVRGFYKENMDGIPDDLRKRIADFETKHNGESLPPLYEKEYELHAKHKEVPYDYIKFSDKVNAMVETSEEEARKKYPKLFKVVDLINGCIVSVGNHPAGCVVSPYPVDEWFGTFTTKTDEYAVSQLNMKEIDALNFVKLDILGLDNIGLIYKTCDLAGIPFLTPDNTPADDMDVWNSIKEDTTLIFQWESESATAYLKQLFSDETIAKIRERNPDFSYMDLLSIGNGAIRPAGESYRDALAHGIYKDNGNKELNEMLKPTLGYLVYQCQIIEFLHKFCGFTMGEADVVRRHFSKKTGTEKDIPIIKDGGVLNEKTGHYIKGFIQTMIDDYGETRESAEKIIVSFLQVIQDASDYLFSKNHADPYSWIGYICGYLRYHYPLECLTTALNIFEGKEEKSTAIINYAKKQNIPIRPIKFRHSVSKYNCDRSTGEIFKGVSSIKYMSETVANEIYDLRDNHYDDFIDVLYDLDRKTTANSRHIKILIELDFFSEFGDANYLLKCKEAFDLYAGKKQLKKQKLADLGIDEETIRSYASKETDKMFSDVNMRLFLKDYCKSIHVPKQTIKQRIMAQLENLGYIDTVGDEYVGMAVVTDLDTKYAPRLKLYSLKNGTTLDCKIDKRTFSKNKLAVGDIIRVVQSPLRAKKRRDENGDWIPIPDQFERWVTEYRKVDL